MTSPPRSRQKGEEEGEEGEEEGDPPATDCLLFGAFGDDACARGKRATIPHSSYAPLLFGGTLPPSTTIDNHRRRPPPPLLPSVASASVAADGFALVASSSSARGLWQCQYDQPGAGAGQWSRVEDEVEGLPKEERFSAVAAGDWGCLALSATDGSVFQWSRRRRREEEEGEDDDDDSDDYAVAKCVLGPRLVDDQETSTPLHRLPVAAIAAGRRHFLAVARPPHAAAFAWGDTSRGQCAVAPGQGEGESGSLVPKPRLIEALGGVVCSMCTAGDRHSLVGAADGAAVFEFGGDGGGSEPSLVQIDLPRAVVALAAGGNHSVALDEEGKVHCWGDGAWGQQPVGGEGDGGAVAAVAAVAAVVAGWRHTALVLK